MLPRPRPEELDVITDLLRILNSARRKVPAVDFALGIAGVAAAGGIVASILGQTKASIIIIGLIFLGMILLFLFSRLAIAKSRSISAAGQVLLWSVLLFFILFLTFTVTSFSIEWPQAWVNFLNIHSQANAPLANTASNTAKKLRHLANFIGYTIMLRCTVIFQFVWLRNLMTWTKP